MKIGLPRLKYWDYIKFSAKTTLKSRYASMYLGYAWWFLDPLFFMVIYMFVYQVVFQRTMEDYIVFILIGLISWRWISGSLTQCSNSIFQRIGLIEQISAPKHIFPLVNLLIETMLFMAALTIIPIAMAIEGVPITWHIIELVPITLVTLVALYGCGMVFSHIGAFIADFKQILSYFLRLLFYMSPIFYNLDMLPSNVQKLFWLNPVTPVVEGYRSVMMHGTSPDYLGLLYVLSIGLVTIPIGYYLLKKFSGRYAKTK
jgi:ABC-type polysaccharide/polyol phosphate export permease